MNVPTSHELERIVERKVEQIPELSGPGIEKVLACGLRRQNRRSTRPGAEVLIHKCDGSIKAMWAKCVEDPLTAYQKIANAYERTRRSGIEAPIPRPYFFDQRSGVILTDKVVGTALRYLALRHALKLDSEPPPTIRRLFERIGTWLGEYHHAVVTSNGMVVGDLIASILHQLAERPYFASEHTEQIANRLRRIQGQRLGEKKFSKTMPHNDFNLRNVVVNDRREFFVVDWDAMVHPLYSPETLGWWDATAFFLNLQSLARLKPIINLARLRRLSSAFLSGYLNAVNAHGSTLSPSEAHTMVYLFALRYWVGLGVERPLALMYRRNLGWRYARALQARLISGTADVL